MTSKPTKQQVAEAYMAHYRAVYNDFDRGFAYYASRAEEGAEILVRAGLAEEPREAGVYPVKVPTPFGTAALFHVAFWDGREWWAIERGERLATPSVVGKRISPPSEE